MQVRWIVHAARKFCEIHVVMNSLTAIAVAQSVTGNLALGKFYLVVAAPLALATAVATLTRDIHRGAAEQEFARWYRAPKDAVEEASSVAEAKADRIGASQSAENSVGQAMPRCLPPRIRRDDANLGR